ncbi:tRNA (guanine(10)-N2)-methyltransferase homolog isoform X2 [Rhodamnia argentea]|uniref:tRNA (guanine(10)-N(2))-methyltransferase n=1 Tax=Rhodamnia argentea TaxID=178133 RepID=A0ABM3HFK5_9MYRT|nr:tRNA (guanine(10)-N2)-methyltransferase homolog isoform X2 [Rhodamnia argentea]
MWFLCVFYHRLLDYRKPEVESLALMFGAFDSDDGGQDGGEHLEWRLPEHHHPDSPFHFVDLPSEDVARDIANRSILVKGIYELWGEGNNYEELEDAIKDYPDERKLPYLSPESTFRITVDSFGKVISFQEQNERIQSLAYIPFKGQVNLRNPDHKFWLMETDDYGTNNGLPPVVQKRIFFGREVGGADRKLLPTYQLKSRTYLGPTAMDAEMAFLMANQAMVKPGKLVYDPFVGTGSILVAAAHFGAMTMGADIDIRVVRDGRGPDCNVWSNFKQYGLPTPIGLLRADNNLPPWRPGLKEYLQDLGFYSGSSTLKMRWRVFDAIICDPPYGVRAGGRKSGGRKLLKGVVGPYTVPDDKRTDHIPSTAAYSLVECVHDLLDLAAKMLVLNGRLVFFYPVLREDESTENHFPEHPCFVLVSASEQILSSRYSRVLLTMVKSSPYTEEIEEEARLKHLEFKENHLKWMEDGNLHSAVFSPGESVFVAEGDPKVSKETKPKYRGKYV